MALTDPTGQPKPLQPGEFTPSGPSAAVKFNLSSVDPPSSLYIRLDDQLTVIAASSQTNEVVTINTRLLLPTGEIVPGQFTINPSATRSTKTASFPLAEGFLLSLSCSASQAITRGQTFVRCFINRGALGSGQPGQMLFADYVTNKIGTGFPGGRAIAPIEGPGFVRQIQIAAPAAGVDMIASVPVNARWRITNAHATLTTSATVANRLVAFKVLGNTGVSFIGPAPLLQAASLVVDYSAGGITATTSNNPAQQVVPTNSNLVLSGANGVQQGLATFTTAIQATDQWSAMILDVEEWLDNV